MRFKLPEKVVKKRSPTELRVAVQQGVIPKARKPFALSLSIYFKEHGTSKHVMDHCLEDVPKPILGVDFGLSPADAKAFMKPKHVSDKAFAKSTGIMPKGPPAKPAGYVVAAGPKAGGKARGKGDAAKAGGKGAGKGVAVKAAGKGKGKRYAAVPKVAAAKALPKLAAAPNPKASTKTTLLKLLIMFD